MTAEGKQHQTLSNKVTSIADDKGSNKKVIDVYFNFQISVIRRFLWRISSVDRLIGEDTLC